MPDTVSALSALDELIRKSEDFRARMQALGMHPDGKKTLRRLFTPGEAAELVGRDRTTLARAEAELDMNGLQRDERTGRRVGYTLEQIQAFRGHFGTLPWRDPNTDAPLYIAFQNFKGGTGKSTSTVNFSHYLGLAGYRVLVVDCDSQATTTSFFGYIPDADLTADDTVIPYFLGTEKTLKYAIRPTHWPTIHLIPACLSLSNLEIGGIVHIADPSATAESRLELFKGMRYGLETVAEDYDVILFDTPPALGVTALMVLLAADALVIPTTAKMADFASTLQFLKMGRDYIGQIDQTKVYRWRQVLITQFNRRGKQSKDSKSLQETFVDSMKGTFGDAMFDHVMPEASEISVAASTFSTPYEQTPPNRRILTQLGYVFGDIEIAIKRCWPSKAEELLQRGLV